MAQDGAEAADALKVILNVHRRWKDSEPKEKRPVQGAFGKILGVSQSTVSRWVEGEGLPRGDRDLLRAINSLLKRESFTTLLEETERSSLDAICEALDKVVTKAKRPRKESFRLATPDDSISHEGRDSFFRDYAAALPSYLEYEVASLSVTFVRMSTLGPGFVAPSLYPVVPAEDRTRLGFDSFAESVAHSASKTLIVGGGGEGKSTLLARLCTELLQAGQVPLWLRARDLIDNCIDDLPAIARKSVARVASGYVGDLAWGVDNAVAVLADDRCILLIDDLDDIGLLGATSAMRLLRDLVATRGRVVATSRGLHPAIQFQSVFRVCPPHEAVLRAKWSFDQKPGVTDHGSPLLVAISAFISSGSAADRLSDAFVLALAEWQRSASVPPTTSPANACGMVLALQNLALRLLDPATPIEEVQRLEPTIHTVARLAAAPELEALEAAVAVGLVVSLAHARRFASRHIHELLAAASLVRGGPMTASKEVDRVINTRAFRRLHCMNQLSFVDAIYPGATCKRFVHCLRTYNLCKQFVLHLLQEHAFRYLFSPEMARQALVFALLHDINHFPLLHIFQESRSRPLKDVDLVDIFSNGRLTHDSPSLEQLLDGLGVTQERFRRVLIHKHHQQTTPHDQIIKSMIDSGADLDKLAYLPYDSLYTGTRYGLALEEHTLIRSATVIQTPESRWHLAYRESAVPALQGLLQARVGMFRKVYWHHTNRAIMSMVLYVIDELDSNGEARRLETISEPASSTVRVLAQMSSKVRILVHPRLASRMPKEDRFRHRAEIFDLVSEAVAEVKREGDQVR